MDWLQHKHYPDFWDFSVLVGTHSWLVADGEGRVHVHVAEPEETQGRLPREILLLQLSDGFVVKDTVITL